LPEKETGLILEVSPHLRHPDSTPRIMWSVVAALSPAAIWGAIVFGRGAILVLSLSVSAALLTEALIEVLFRKPLTIGDGSAAVTGLLVALVLPSNAPWFVPVVASVVAIAVAKQAFGGLGCNIWNPALVGRAFVQVAYPRWISQAAWPKPQIPDFLSFLASGHADIAGGPLSFDAVSAATPLSTAALKEVVLRSEHIYSLKDLFFGFVPGSIGEISKFLLLLGAIFLIARKYVNWRVPLFYIVAFALLVFLLPGKKVPEQGLLASGIAGHAWMTLYQVLSGGLIIGAFFMATDMVTSPVTDMGLIIFALGCGVMAALIRLYGGYPEGVCYSILFMNTAVPLIDRLTRPKVFGGTRR